MPMEHKDFLTGLCVEQPECLMNLDIWEQVCLLVGVGVVEAIEIVSDSGWRFPVHVVVAEEHQQAFLLMKGGEQLIHIAVRFPDVVKPLVFPHFVPIARLDECKTMCVVVRQGMEKNALIVRELVCGAVVSPVRVAEDDEAVRIIKRDHERFVIGLIQSLVRVHVVCLSMTIRCA